MSRTSWILSRVNGSSARAIARAMPGFQAWEGTARARVAVELLERRVLFAVSPAGLSPAQVRHAYSIDQITLPWGTPTQNVPADGRNQEIAIVDPYDDPTIFNDLQVFSQQFGLPTTDVWGYGTLTKATPFGVPAVNASWVQEISLDVEWAHAIAPYADILLVEAKSASYTDLINAVDWARQQPQVVAVSMSWGGSEFQGEQNYDSTFTTPAGHLGGSRWAGGIVFTTASGDDGAGSSYPSASPNVLSVGGTTLNLSSSGAYLSETAWSGSGGGTSSIEGTNMPTVAWDADPNTGVAVYDSTPYQRQSGWLEFGGTSVGAPAWAGLVADIDQGLNSRGQGSLDGATQLIPDLFKLPSTDFHDIVSGSNGQYSAGVGYDLVTGLGTPYGFGLIRDLVGGTVTGVNPGVTAAFAPTVSSAKVTAAAKAIAHPTAAAVQTVAAGNSGISQGLGSSFFSNIEARSDIDMFDEILSGTAADAGVFSAS